MMLTNEQQAKYAFTSISWLLLISTTACFCYLHGLFADEGCPSVIKSLGWSLRDWTVWLFLMPVLFSQIKVTSMNRSELNHYLVHLFKLAVILCSVSIFIKLIIDQATTDEQLLSNSYYYLSYELKVFVVFTLFAHFFKFHWQQKCPPSPPQESQSDHSQNHLFQDIDHHQLFLVNKGNQQLYITKEEIDWVVACGNYAEIYSHGEHYIMRTTMKELEHKLGHDHFVRIHRSYIVNKNSIQSIQSHKGQSLVSTSCGEKLPLGRTYLEKLPELQQRPLH